METERVAAMGIRDWQVHEAADAELAALRAKLDAELRAREEAKLKRMEAERPQMNPRQETRAKELARLNAIFKQDEDAGNAIGAMKLLRQNPPNSTTGGSKDLAAVEGLRKLAAKPTRQPEYTEGELATALRNYEAFHRLPFGSATVEQLQSSSANIGGWLRDGIQQEAIAKWHEMSRHFDADHSGDITPVEFIDGFKKKAMGEALDWEGIKSMPEQTYLDVQAKINESVNRRLQNHVKMARAYLAQDAVPPSGGVELSPPWNTKGWKRVSTRSADQLRVNTENQEKIEEIFNHLDQTKDGVLTKDDFRPTTSGEVSL